MGEGVGSRGGPAKFGTGVGFGCWWVGAAVLLGVVVPVRVDFGEIVVQLGFCTLQHN